ncbi:MAG: glycoside hydrolase family 2, partial [Ferruginibacter sp.]|nr:glycoside hydrolase family 2 [Ferruginibacter sp.]
RFYVNGYPIFIRGTNWVPEAMLRNTETRTLAELRYTRQAGINFIRIWGGGIAESDYFYDLCDSLGILVWSEFWITGDTRFPTDTALYFKNMTATVKRLRNHASQAYYVSANESTEIAGAGKLIKSLDPNTGYQVQSECCGVHDGSPYKYENPMQYFENTASPRGSRVDGFNPEYGTPCLPTVEALREMMPAKDLWPINDSVWKYLDGGGFHQMTTKYKQAVNEFGLSSSIEEFAKKAQFVGALNFRAIWEVWNYNKFNFGDRFASGFLFWYHNSPVRQTSARLYDWSLEPTAALYYSQNGLQPLHPQFDYLKNTISVYNDYRKEFKNYTVDATVYDINSKVIVSLSAKINIPADALVKDALKIEFPLSISAVHFIKLVLKDDKGRFVSDAFYWRSTNVYKGAWTMTGPAVAGFQEINTLPPASLKVVAACKKTFGNNHVAVAVTNASSAISFFTQLKLKKENGEMIKPAFYSDNFFCLLPGESKRINIEFSDEQYAGNKLKIEAGAFNSKEFTVEVIRR